MNESNEVDPWPINRPRTLEDTCILFLVNNIFKYLDPTDDSYCLKPGISFPQGLSDKILQNLVTSSKLLSDPSDNVFGMFNNRATTSLTELPLRYTAVTNEQLNFLCLHPIRKLDISYCSEIKSQFIDAINQASRTLQYLQIGGNDVIERLDYLLHEEKDENTHVKERGDASQQKHTLDLPHLRSLCLREFQGFKPIDDMPVESHKIIERVIQPLRSLTHLDLYLCGWGLGQRFLIEIGNLDLPNLVSLTLCDTLNGSEQAFDNLMKLRKLRHLDISQADDANWYLPVKYRNPEKRLSRLLEAMPNLQSLDISGTNLAGELPVDFSVSHRLEPKKQEEEPKQCALPGNDGRHFDFLGLLNCPGDPCQRANLPASKITGDGNEDQILLSVFVYRDKPTLLTRAFNALFNKFRFEMVKAHSVALEYILSGMERNKHDKHVQISGSASLFYIVKGIKKHLITHTQKRRVISCLLDAMERHMTELTMMRNGCLTLCHFNIPEEVLHCYTRLVKVLLQMLQHDHNDDFLMRIGIFLLNSLACQVESEQKQILGDLSIIEVMCAIIKVKLNNHVCDEILEVCWSLLWNVTDETEPNCSRFMDEEGMYLFLDCLKAFPEKEELLRNMMGLMGNIAEVQRLRSTLMNEEYVQVFTDFLESEKDVIEVSYNAAGVLSHLLSDGEKAWTIARPSRDEVIYRIVQAIRRWPIKSSRNINYRSFGPILQLVTCYQSHASQYWAIWALRNLTSVYPDKYIQLLKDEGGLEALGKVTRDPRPNDAIKKLAQDVIDFINNPTSQESIENGDV
ncbi:protein zer-1 homolog [Mya arenaria]|uniref:protein zer-1 homolog n=1 Tax=Mya arenaria TaxID=6604 RepID=UPI0022E920CA|nr:protein zer-1 homolog [Mya arenaria]